MNITRERKKEQKYHLGVQDFYIINRLLKLDINLTFHITVLSEDI